MRKRWIGIGIAGAAVALSLLNASWIAPRPKGRLMVVAQRGIAQPLADEAPANGCTASSIRFAEDNPFIDNSLPSLFKASRLGADAVEVDVRRTRDGQMVLFRDETLECRTNGRGRVAERTLAELKTLDIGWGYTPDRRSFPLRGRGVGGMPTVEEALWELQGSQIIFNLRGSDPADADALAAAFARAGVKLAGPHGFHAAPPVAARLRVLAPDAWVFEAGRLGDCLAAYPRLGWLGIVPHACRRTTVGVPTEGQWTIWGWPYRFLSRIAGAGSRTMMYEAAGPGGIEGLKRPEQLGDVPRDFKGHLFIADFHTVGRALRR